MILPVSSPTLTPWTWVACVHAILLPHFETHDWLFNNFISISCEHDIIDKGRLFIDYVPRACGNQFVSCPFIYDQKVLRDVFNDTIQDFGSFLKTAFMKGNYVYTLINQKYMLNSVENYIHETFLYGISDDLNSLYTGDFSFSKSGRYMFAEVSIEDVVRGFKDVSENNDYLKSIWLLKYIGNVTYQFNIEWFKQTIKDYIDSNDPYYSYRYLPVNNKPFCFGLSVYNAIYEITQKALLSNSSLDIRMFHFLYSYDRFMLSRLEYLLKHRLLSDQQLIKKCTYIIHEEAIMQMLSIKYNLDPKACPFESILNRIIMVRRMKEKLMYSLLSGVHKSPNS